MPFKIKQDSIIMGVTEFRNNIPSLLKENYDEEIIIVNRDKPFGVLINFKKYQNMQELIEIAEDYFPSEMVKESKKIKGKLL
ncbi:MAG TPA: type II toxin-antitoxin system prevent-host-death family antitoxin [bacterium]|nr:type II toxin-antitoxin system prevent-host-death family antitoxin [bacterium]HOL46951.1 type II toxin-antitoxin system prevent-host-death family antitoxin [bacterium]HPQ18216.1 type II toxin-antitoxin system prevent-host-death family antitoxin [bacterium]